MKLLVVFVLLPVCCHGFWHQFYDPVKVNALKGWARRTTKSENDFSTSGGHEINKRHVDPPAEMLRSSYGSEIERVRLMSNDEQDPNATTNETEHKEHHGVHVAGWNWDYIEEPMIICLFISIVSVCKLGESPDSKVHGAIMGPIWDRQDPGGPHVGPMNFAIWVISWANSHYCIDQNFKLL